ncbi:MAG: AFG1 family ATPase [Gammaproteobacteria bacterium]|nr:AFG1 family ATPase [Gammaproteobacteria bacterium]
MSPLNRYEAALDSGELHADAEQKSVVSKLDAIYQQLITNPLPRAREERGLLSRLFSRQSVEPPKIAGLYLWGGVGRGKTHLTDLFYEVVPFEEKSRLHFHHFMKRIHDELRELKEIEDPLSVIADNWIKRSRLLVLDEMHVNDITDAMLLGGLLTALFERGLTLVTTSNVHPDNLYREGLQRDRFIPAIEQIKHHTEVYEMDSGEDYRLRALESADIYIEAKQADSEAILAQHFERLCKDPNIYSTEPLLLNRRALAVERSADGVVWFTFDELCNTPRSTHDYIDIATLFHTVIISDLPVLNDNRNDEARRLVNLIDELYDRGVNLIVSAFAEPELLYTGTRLSFEFVRAASRLREMQTIEYLSSRSS